MDLRLQNHFSVSFRIYFIFRAGRQLGVDRMEYMNFPFE